MVKFLLKKPLQLPPLLSYEAPQGTLASGYGIAPSGTLTVKENQNWIEMHYIVPSGTQKVYHPHPGKDHSKIYRVAYLPRSKSGHSLLVRYQYAFLHGHAFSVGYSNALQLDDQVTWSSWMPHKTARTGGGPFGYPDENFVEQAHQALDRLNVPLDIQTCQRWCLQQHQHQQRPAKSSPTNTDVLFQIRRETISFVAPDNWWETFQISRFFEIPKTSEFVNVRSPKIMESSARERQLTVVASAPSVSNLAYICPILPPSTTEPLPLQTGSFEKLQKEVSPENSRTSLRPATIVTAEDLTIEGLQRSAGGHDAECPVCSKPLSAMDQKSTAPSDPHCIRIIPCGHFCHSSCMLGLLRQHRHCAFCPRCSQQIGITSLGGAPSGRMSLSLDRSLSCPGFDHGDGVICIHYDIPSGTQTSYMSSPGQNYEGTCRIAFLPNTNAGRKVFVRLRYAFSNGLTFHVAKSRSTNLENQVTWAAIPHKTSLDGGEYGYPDPEYLRKCGEALYAAGVPTAEKCVELLEKDKQPKY